MIRLLDLYCGAGGAAYGYALAGFDVTGVDHRPQPRYPFRFVEADAATYPLAGFDAIHASPPCQRYAKTRVLPDARDDHPDLMAWTRARLDAAGVPWVIENVPGAPMAPLVMLCGSAFGLGIPGYQLRRHRWFELSAGWWTLSPPCQHDGGPAMGIYGDHGRDSRRSSPVYGRYFTLDERRAAMGISWMKRDELDQAVPPAYTRYLGRDLMAACSAASWARAA